MLSQAHHQLQQQQQHHHHHQQQQQQQQQPQYHYITTTGDDGQTPTTIVFENYNSNVNRNGNCIEIETPTTTIIKFETDDNNYEEFEVVRSTAPPSNDNSDSNSITTTAEITSNLPASTTTTTTNTTATNNNNKKAPKRRHTYAQHQLQMKQEQEMQQQQQQQQPQQQNETIEFISNSEDANNQALSSGNESLLMVPKIPNVKQKRKRKTRVVTDDEQGEYLEKMSVRGLDIQRYEHIIDGVSYCLVCAKNDIYKTFKNKYSFQRHAYLFHEGENRKIFACPICNKEFSRPDKMKMHKKDKHGDMPVPDSTNNNVGVENSTNKNNTTAKRARNVGSAQRTPRARKRGVNGEAPATAKNKRLAQIDSVLDEVQNADSNNSTKNNILMTRTTNNHSPQQQQQQLTQQQQQQLPSIDLNGMILPGGAQLALANPSNGGHMLQQHRVTAGPLLQAATGGNNTPTLIYSNQIELPQALLQQQLHGQSQIMIQDQAGNLVPLQSLTTTLDSNGQTIYTASTQQQQTQLLQPQQVTLLNTGQQQAQQTQQLLTLTPQQLKLTTTPNQQQQQQQTTGQNNAQHLQTQHNQQQQQQHFDMDNVAYLSSTAATPAPTEHQVIGTVQSYQILTPDGLQNYQSSVVPKLEPADLSELCPYSSSLGTTTPQYTFSTHGGHHTLTAGSDPMLHHHNHHQQHQQTQQQHHQQHQQQQHTTSHLSAHPQFMEIKNELLLKGADTYTLDATSMYHLPFSPTSMINAVNDVNSSSLLETKEISYDISEAVLLAL